MKSVYCKDYDGNNAYAMAHVDTVVGLEPTELSFNLNSGGINTDPAYTSITVIQYGKLVHVSGYMTPIITGTQLTLMAIPAITTLKKVNTHFNLSGYADGAYAEGYVLLENGYVNLRFNIRVATVMRMNFIFFT